MTQQLVCQEKKCILPIFFFRKVNLVDRAIDCPVGRENLWQPLVTSAQRIWSAFISFIR